MDRSTNDAEAALMKDLDTCPFCGESPPEYNPDYDCVNGGRLVAGGVAITCYCDECAAKWRIAFTPSCATIIELPPPPRTEPARPIDPADWEKFSAGLRKVLRAKYNRR